MKKNLVIKILRHRPFNIIVYWQVQAVGKYYPGQQENKSNNKEEEQAKFGGKVVRYGRI